MYLCFTEPVVCHVFMFFRVYGLICISVLQTLWPDMYFCFTEPMVWYVFMFYRAYGLICTMFFRAYGPMCILTCLKKSEPLPTAHPIFCLAMKGLVVSCTSVLKEQRVRDKPMRAYVLFLTKRDNLECWDFLQIWNFSTTIKCSNR